MNMSSDDKKPSSWVLITVIIVIVIGMFLVWKFLFSNQPIEDVTQIVDEPIVTEVPLDVMTNVDEVPVEIIDDVITESLVLNEESPLEMIKNEPISITPALDQSDSWVQKQLSGIIWKKELLGLLINEDIIRRFVVFVDNFAQGNIVYSHSPFVKPLTSFIAKEQIENDSLGSDSQIFKLDESSFKRFSIYVDLLRAADTDILVEWYKELQPLITEAYSELGYPEQEFKDVLQRSIVKVLDLEFPKGNIELVQPSVMYQYKSLEIEALDDADKLMLRIGKDNLLIIKSVLLEINEKIIKM